jgi:hypothetical protein
LTAPKGVKCGPALHLLIRPLNSSHIARRKKHGASGFIWGFFIDPTEKNSNSLLRQGYEGRESTRRSRRVKVGASRKRGFREWSCAEQILKMLISNPPAPPYAASTPHGAFAGSACFCSNSYPAHLKTLCRQKNFVLRPMRLPRLFQGIFTRVVTLCSAKAITL